MRGKAYKFDGHDYIDVGSDDSLDIVKDITISFWVKPTGGIDSYTAFLGRGLSSSWGFYGDTGVTPDANASNVATIVSVEGTPGGGAPAVPSNHHV